MGLTTATYKNVLKLTADDVLPHGAGTGEVILQCSATAGGQTTFDVGQSFSNDTRLFHLDKLTPKQITFRIWAEGNDPECDNDVQDANVTFEMLFGGTDENNSTFD